MERDEARVAQTTPEALEKWYTDHIRTYYDAIDRIILGNQVCNWKFPFYFEDCIVADFFRDHGKLRPRGKDYNKEFMKEAKGYISQVDRRADL